MLPNAQLDAVLIARQRSTVATSLPLGEIIAFAIGGPALFTLLILLVIFCVRRAHRRENKKLTEVEDAEASKENDVPSRTIPTALVHPERSPLDQYLSPEQALVAVSNEWLEDESMMDSPPRTKAQAKRLSQKGLFQIPGIRDSWPLTTSIPNVPTRLLQSNSSMVTLNQAGGGGYVLPQEPKWPARSYSRKSRTKIFVSAEESNMQRFSTDLYDAPTLYESMRYQRRSASENQLSTILRSTSQRLKAAHRTSLSRTLTTLGRSPSPARADKLQTHHKAVSESREDLVEHDSDDTECAANSIYDAYLVPSPSPSRKVPRNSAQGSLRRRSSVTPSSESILSFCAGATQDLVIPTALTSPSKTFFKSPQRHAIGISSASSKDLSAMVQKEGRASALGLGGQGSAEETTAPKSPHRISLTSDPFYSLVKGGIRAVPHNKIIGPRPLHMRQTTSGQEAASERPSSVASISSSPLCSISGNAQSRICSPTASEISELNRNPFSWDPQNASPTGIKQNPSRNGSRKKGHKRTSVVRISIQPRSSCAYAVPEDSEEDSSPWRFNIPLAGQMHAAEPTKSPSPKSSSASKKRLSARSSSVSSLNPVFSISDLAKGNRGSVSESPPLGLDVLAQIYSPTLVAANYYSERGTSEDDFFNARPVEAGDSLQSKSNLHQKHHVVAAFPRLEHKEHFPSQPLTVNTSFDPRLSLLPPPLSPALLIPRKSPQGLRSPPVLAQPSATPSHLNGPRSEPPKRSSKASLELKGSLLQQSICLLRRMNSEVSRSSVTSYDDEEGRSPPPSQLKVPSSSPNWSQRQGGQSPGSKAYLSMGMGGSPSKSRIGKRKSAMRDRISKTHKIKEEDETDELVDWKRNDLEIKGESSSDSPGLTSVQVKLKGGIEQTPQSPTPTPQGEAGTSNNEIPTGEDSLTTKLVTPNSPPKASAARTVRWSDATPSPTLKATRRQSRLLQPKVQTSPSCGGGKSKLGKEEPRRVEDVKENLVTASVVKDGLGNWNGNFGRPDSLGLYDSDGFLMSPPNKAGVRGAQ